MILLRYGANTAHMISACRDRICGRLDTEPPGFFFLSFFLLVFRVFAERGLTVRKSPSSGQRSPSSAEITQPISILHLAALSGSIECLDIIRNAHPEEHDFYDIDAHDFDGNTPLMWACSARNRDMVRHLLNLGADVNAKLSAATCSFFFFLVYLTLLI